MHAAGAAHEAIATALAAGDFLTAVDAAADARDFGVATAIVHILALPRLSVDALHLARGAGEAALVAALRGVDAARRLRLLGLAADVEADAALAAVVIAARGEHWAAAAAALEGVQTLLAAAAAAAERGRALRLDIHWRAPLLGAFVAFGGARDAAAATAALDAALLAGAPDGAGSDWARLNEAVETAAWGAPGGRPAWSVLGLGGPGAGPDAARAARGALLRAAHPDRGAPSPAAAQRINGAYAAYVAAGGQ